MSAHDLGDFLCGHDRNGANTKWVRNGSYAACLTCFRERDRLYRRARRASKAADPRTPTPQDA